MNNVIFVAQLFDNIVEDEEYQEIVETNNLRSIEIEKVKQALLLKANELNNIGIIIPLESWELIFKDAIQIYAQREYDEVGNLLPRPQGFARTCVNIAVKEMSPINIPNEDLIESGEFDPHFNPYSDGNHFSF